MRRKVALRSVLSWARAIRAPGQLAKTPRAIAIAPTRSAPRAVHPLGASPSVNFRAWRTTAVGAGLRFIVTSQGSTPGQWAKAPTATGATESEPHGARYISALRECHSVLRGCRGHRRAHQAQFRRSSPQMYSE